VSQAAPSTSPKPDAQAQGDEADKAMEQLARFGSILRRRWLIVSVTSVLAISGAFAAISMLKPKWRASSSLVLHLAGPQVLDKVKGVSDDNEGRVFAYKEYYQTQREIIGSRIVAERALGTLGLAQDPVFLGVDGIRSEAERLAKASQIDPVERLRELVFVEEVRGSRLLRISADYPDPQIAADIANAVADAFLEHITQSRARTGESAERNMGSERDKALAALQAAEKALADFKQAHGISSISLADRQNVITEAIIATNANLKDAEAQRFVAQSAYNEAAKLHEQGSHASISLLPPLERELFDNMRTEQLEAEREVEQLSVKYGDKMPDLQQARRRLNLISKRVVREEKELLEALKARANAAISTTQQLSASLSNEKRRALELTQLEREYRALERESTTAAETYTLVARRDTEIEMSNRVGSEDIEILDRATRPREPVFPPKLLLLAVAAMGGLVLGSLLALAIDVRDHRIRGLLDLERALAGFGLPILGQLPLLPADARLGNGNLRAQRRHRDLHSLLFPQSLMAERCRAIRTSLGFVQGGSPCRTLVVTSPNSNEGKSSTAINLAISFSQAKKRVILVDADMRRPRLHQLFPAPIGKEAVGLAHVLSGKCSLDDAVLTQNEDLPDNLHILLCGEIPQNPAELLDSGMARKLLAELAERYDVAILDSPPVLPVTDPLILARAAHGLIVVARCQSTTRAELQRTLSLLRQGDNNLLGVVLNEVDTRREEAGYGVGYYAYHARDTSPEQA